MSETVFDRIKQKLDEFGVKESRAALEAGLSTTAIRNIRRRGGTPNGHTLEKLGTYFGVSPDWLLTGRESSSDSLLDRIYERLDTLGLTESRASKDAGLCMDYIRGLRRRGGIPHGDALQKLADFLGVSTDWLLTGRDAQGETKAPSANVIEIPAGASVYLNAVEVRGHAYVLIGCDGVKIIPAASSQPTTGDAS